MIKLLLALFLGLSVAAQAAPKAQLWEYWLAHDADSVEHIDHSAWDMLLERYLSEGGGEAAGVALFDYAAVNDGDTQALRDYLQRLSQVDIAAYSRDEQRAYWINLYNALTVDVILQNYPVDSIRDISDGFFSSGPWEEKRFSVGGEQVSLDEIEHRILRPIWKDARLHYALNCASIGCPNLAQRAYTAANTEELLEAGARNYVNHSRGVHIKDGRLTVSSIYEWFKEDFGGDDAGVISHLQQYAEEGLRQSLSDINTIDDDTYDWALNGVQ